MRFAPVAAASVIVLGALVGGITASSNAAGPGTAQQRSVALASSPDLSGAGGDNNGNG